MSLLTKQCCPMCGTHTQTKQKIVKPLKLLKCLGCKDLAAEHLIHLASVLILAVKSHDEGKGDRYVVSPTELLICVGFFKMPPKELTLLAKGFLDAAELYRDAEKVFDTS